MTAPYSRSLVAGVPVRQQVQNIAWRERQEIFEYG